MRVVWGSAAALALLAVTSALRTTQVEGASKLGRRLPAPTASDSPAETSELPDEPHTIRSRTSRRRDETPTREVRTRTRSRPTEKPEISSEAPLSAGRNERFDSRRTHNRPRGRRLDIETSTVSSSKDTVIRNRSRQGVRRLTTTLAPEVTSPIIDETKIEVINSNLDELAKVTPKDEILQTVDVNSQFRRRSSTVHTTERVVPQRVRSRINTRPNPRSLDLDVAGTTNSLTSPGKEPTTVRTSDLRNSRKLRYKTRLSETDTNLNGEGLITQNEVIKTSQNDDNAAIQPDVQTTAAEVVENNIQQSTERQPERATTSKVTNIVRRKLTRGKGNFRPSGSLPKTRPSEEIGEDDNYPESFKALIQAKNASTQANSPPSESLSVKASQKVYKTYTASSQSTNTGLGLNKYTRFRGKLNAEKRESREDKYPESPSAEELKPKVPEFRPRGSFTPRSKKISSLSSSSTSAPNSSNTSEKSQYKFSRRSKTISTESPLLEDANSPKRNETNALLKKTARPSYYQRKNYPKKNVTAEQTVNQVAVRNINRNRTTHLPVAKSTLPRTSYYSRLRNKKNNTSSTEESTKEAETDKKIEDKNNKDRTDLPLIFTLLKNPINMDTSSEKMQYLDSEQNQDKDNMFIIAVSSKESLESRSINEVTNMADESDNNPVFNTSPTTVKYHANYKDVSSTSAPDSKENMISSTITPVRNIQTRKYGRKFSKSFDQSEHSDEIVPKLKEKTQRKYGESFSKTAEASTNGIAAESEKSRSRFSSKYRGPHVERPIYKATVPTVTTSTAWLKFFVTDQLLTKSVEEPIWFEDDDLYDVRTESMARQTTTPPIIHEASLELEEGEEIDLGPDMNAISFTKTRSTLNSADLRLSESLVKQSHVMNVEASHHSPSVTISIFDVLAEILTSTPRTRLSSTTEVTQNQNTKSNVIQTFNGVSNINVDSVGDSSSQNTLISTSADISTSAKSVQTTETTPNVINRLSVGEGVTPLLNNDKGAVDPVNTLEPFSTPTPTTPISARKPFAIRVLYSDTDSNKDTFPTTTVAASIQPSTDPTMVYNTVSDLLLSNNNLVSSELTSMLSNNIKSIIQNMDESSRSRITLDMAELLKTLIPRAIDGLATVVNDVDIVPSTTPYSLEDIKDTENIDLFNTDDTELKNINILQNVQSNIVNSTTNSSSIIDGELNNKTVNTSGTTQTTLSISSSNTTPVGITLATVPSNSFNPPTQILSPTFTEKPTTAFSAVLGIDTVKNDIKVTGRLGEFSTETSKNALRFPFLTNFDAGDFNFSESAQPTLNIKSVPLKTLSSSSIKHVDDFEIDNPSEISKFQLWVLSKKARVLKMIEDLIREHNDELATAQPLTDFISQTSNIPLSNRLTKIITDMGLTTETTILNDDLDLTSPTTIPNNNVPTSTTTENLDAKTLSENLNNGNVLARTESLKSPLEVFPTTMKTSDLSFSFGATQADFSQTTSTTSEIVSQENLMGSTEQVAFDIFNRNQENDVETTISVASANTEITTPQDNTETTTDVKSTETTTQAYIDVTTQTDFEGSTTINNENKPNNVSSVRSEAVVTQPTVPKKDYVIFGILPNNTVVRKDPNDNVLETLTEASPYIVYGVLPNNTVIRKFPNGTRVPRVMQKIDILPISPWSLKNPYSPIHNNPAIVRPQSNPNRISTNIVTSTDTTNNGMESRLTTDTIPSSALNIKDSSSLGITTATNKPPAEKSTASHVLSLRTTTMLPSVDEILLNSISSAAKEDLVISSMTSSTSEPRILTLDIDPETQQIRTEKPGDGDGSSKFKFIPIDEVTVAQQNTNVLKLASTKTSLVNTEKTETTTTSTITEANSQTPQIQSRVNVLDVTTTSLPIVTNTNAKLNTATLPSTIEALMELNVATTESSPTATLPSTLSELTTTMGTTTTFLPITTLAQTTTMSPTTSQPITTTPASTTTEKPTVQTTTNIPKTTTSLPTVSAEEEKQYQQDAQLLRELLQGTVTRNPKNLNTPADIILNTFTTTVLPTTNVASNYRTDEAQLLQALLGATGQTTNALSISNIGDNIRDTTTMETTSPRSIEDDLRQFEEDTKLLKALLQATGQNPAKFNIPTLNIKTPSASAPIQTTTFRTTPTTTTTTITPRSTTTNRPPTTAQTIDEDIIKLQEDTKLLQALLQATGQNKDNFNIPVISGITSNVRIASNPLTTSLESNPTTPVIVRPVYTTTTTTSSTPVLSVNSRNIFSSLLTTTENVGISTTFTPFNQGRRVPITTASVESSTIVTGRRAPASRVTATTEMPSTSTFSVEEDLAFLKNLKTVLKTNTNNEDPESALANRIIALAVEKSLNEIQSNQPNSDRSGKAIASNTINVIPTTTTTSTTTTTTTTTTTERPTTTSRPTTTVITMPSLEDDIKQFQEDTKLLQTLLQAAGQDPAKFNIPTLPPLQTITKVSDKLHTKPNGVMKQYSNIMTSPTKKLNTPKNPYNNRQTLTKTVETTTTLPYGAKIAVKDNLKTVQDDENLLKALVKLQDAQVSTTQRNKLAITGQTSDEALKNLLQNQQKSKPSGMQPQATQAPMSLSTEFGKSNDALLAALLKEQGFGPTTASSLDEQLRLSALLNQVVVTPKARRTTTPPPPPPPPPQRRPILDGIAWLWQQWRETSPGPNTRPNRRPTPSASPAVASSAATSNRVNWFGSGPFVGNADDQSSSSNRVPLDPPRAVTSEQTPGRPQLVSAAINVTRAFSQFLGAAIQGAAQTVQNVIRAGQRAATDVYVSGSGGSG